MLYNIFIMKNNTLIYSSIAALIIAFLLIYFYKDIMMQVTGYSPTPSPIQKVFCTMDARQCPDGTYVGRTGPNCEFVCPTK
jgi:hypothetical protein